MKRHSGIPGNVTIFSNSHPCPSPSAVKSPINTLKGTKTLPSKERYYQVLQFKNNQHLFQQNKHTQTNYTKQHPIATNHLTLPEIKLAPEKNGIPQIKGLSSNHQFSGSYVRFREGNHLPNTSSIHTPQHLPKNIQALKERVGQFPCFYGNLQKMVPSNMGNQENTRTNMYIYSVYCIRYIKCLLHSCVV